MSLSNRDGRLFFFKFPGSGALNRHRAAGRALPKFTLREHSAFCSAVSTLRPSFPNVFPGETKVCQQLLVENANDFAWYRAAALLSPGFNSFQHNGLLFRFALRH